jgi:hypothetical protein
VVGSTARDRTEAEIDRLATVRGDFSNLPTEPGDIVLRLLHTADWHLGRRFPSFPEDAQKKLSRARMDVIASILDVARRNAVHALLCAGTCSMTGTRA